MDKSYLGAWDVPDDGDLVLTIDKAARDDVKNERGTERKLTIHFVEDYKPMILNATNCKAITKLYKTPYIEEWTGKQIIVRVQQVKAFGDLVDALRIKPEIPTKAPEFKCVECGKVLQPFGGMNARGLADYTRQNYGKVLCAECAKKAKDAKDAKDAEKEAVEADGT
jgi:RNase P subunit RPR2